MADVIDSSEVSSRVAETSHAHSPLVEEDNIPFNEEGRGEETGSNKRRRTNVGSATAGKCYRCDEPGHVQANCPRAVPPSAEPLLPKFQVDRDQICPALLRVFTTHGSLHKSSDFAEGRLPPNESRLHFWPD